MSAPATGKPAVVMLATKFYARSDMGGGLERSARRLIRWLVAEGHRVTVLTRNYDGLPRHEVIDGARVERLPVWGRTRVGASASYLVLALAWLIAHRREYQVVHAHQSYAPATISTLAKLITRAPVVVKISTADAFSERRELERLPLFSLRRRLLRRVDRFVAVNAAAGEEFQGLGIEPRRVAHIANGVSLPAEAPADAAARAAARRALGLPEGRIALFVGRLSAEKGLDTLLDAWPGVLAACPGARLVLVGDGGTFRSVEAELRARVRREGLERAVWFAGRVEDVDAYLRAAEVFVLPSRTEGMSNALLEAMAAGLPIVATRVPGNAALITDGQDGWLVPPGDAAALAGAMRQALTDAELAARRGLAARERARSFAIERVGASYAALYRELAARASVRGPGGG